MSQKFEVKKLHFNLAYMKRIFKNGLELYLVNTLAIFQKGEW